MLRRAWLSLAVLLTTVSSQADAGAPTTRVDRARALFEQGVVLSQRENWQQAAEKYQASLELKRHPTTLYSLGVSQRESEQPLAALQSFRAFLAEPASGPDGPTFRRAAQEAVDELVRRVGRVIVRTDPAHASVYIDGRPCASRAEPCFVAAGSHSIVVTEPGFQDVARTVQVEAGETIGLELSLTLNETPVFPIVMLGLGGAAFVGGLLLTIVGVDASASTMAPSASTVAEIAVGNTLMAAGVAGVAAGWTWLVLEPEARAPKELAILPYVGAGTAGIRVQF